MNNNNKDGFNTIIGILNRNKNLYQKVKSLILEKGEAKPSVKNLQKLINNFTFDLVQSIGDNESIEPLFLILKSNLTCREYIFNQLQLVFLNNVSFHSKSQNAKKQNKRSLGEMYEGSSGVSTPTSSDSVTSTAQFVEGQCNLIYNQIVSIIENADLFQFWYLFLENWLFETLELLFKSNLLSYTQHRPAQSNTNKIVYNFQNFYLVNQSPLLLISMLYQLIEKITIDQFMKNNFSYFSNQRKRYNQVKWILAWISFKYPNQIIQFLFMNLFSGSGSGAGSQKHIIELLEFISIQHEESTLSVFKEYLEEKRISFDSFKSFLSLISRNQYLYNLILKSLFQYFTINKVQEYVQLAGGSKNIDSIIGFLNSTLVHSNFQLFFNYFNQILNLITLATQNEALVNYSNQITSHLIFHLQSEYLKGNRAFFKFNEILKSIFDQNSYRIGNHTLLDLVVTMINTNEQDTNLILEPLAEFVKNLILRNEKTHVLLILLNDSTSFKSTKENLISALLSVKPESELIRILKLFREITGTKENHQFRMIISKQWLLFIQFLFDHPNSEISNESLDLYYHSFEVENQNSILESLEAKILLKLLLSRYFQLLKNNMSLHSDITIKKTKLLYIKILNNSNSNLIFTINLILDYVFSKETCLVLKPNLTYLIPPSISTISPLFSFDDYQNSLEGNLNSFGHNIVLNYNHQQPQHSESNDQQQSLFEINYSKKSYQYKFNDMNIPKHLPFKSKGLDEDHQIHHQKEFEDFYQRNEKDILGFIHSMVLGKRERLEVFSDLLLHNLTSVYPDPSIENYQELLPKPSTFERDVFIRKIFQQNSICYKFLLFISRSNPAELCKYFEIVKSLLVNEISYWASEKFIKSTKESNHYQSTRSLLYILIESELIMKPLSMVIELIDSISPEEVSYLLMSIFNFLKDYPPSQSQYNIDDNGSAKRLKPTHLNQSIYLQPLKSIFHNHINEFAFLYGRFFNNH